MRKLIYLWCRITGKAYFRTVYKDGKRTVRMSYRICKGYADIFGGHVVFDIPK